MSYLVNVEAIYECKGIHYGLAIDRTTNFKGGDGRTQGWVARFYAPNNGGMVAQGTSGVGRETAVSNAKRNLITRYGMYGVTGLTKIS